LELGLGGPTHGSDCGGSGVRLLSRDLVFFDDAFRVGICFSELDDVGEEGCVALLHLLRLLDRGFALFDQFLGVFFSAGEGFDLAVQVFTLPPHAARILSEVADLREKKDAESGRQKGEADLGAASCGGVSVLSGVVFELVHKNFLV